MRPPGSPEFPSRMGPSCPFPRSETHLGQAPMGISRTSMLVHQPRKGHSARGCQTHTGRQRVRSPVTNDPSGWRRYVQGLRRRRAPQGFAGFPTSSDPPAPIVLEPLTSKARRGTKCDLPVTAATRSRRRGARSWAGSQACPRACGPDRGLHDGARHYRPSQLRPAPPGADPSTRCVRDIVRDDVVDRRYRRARRPRKKRSRRTEAVLERNGHATHRPDRADGATSTLIQGPRPLRVEAIRIDASGHPLMLAPRINCLPS